MYAAVLYTRTCQACFFAGLYAFRLIELCNEITLQF